MKHHDIVKIRTITNTALTYFGTEDENRWGITQSLAILWQYSLKATKKPAAWFQTAINISIVSSPKEK